MTQKDTPPTLPSSRPTGPAYRAPAPRRDRIRADMVLQMVALACDITVDEMIVQKRHSSRACRARWLALYLAHIGFGWPLDRVAFAFGVNRATAGHGCRWVEDARENRILDDRLDQMEGLMRDLCDAPVLAFPV